MCTAMLDAEVLAMMYKKETGKERRQTGTLLKQLVSKSTPKFAEWI